MFDNRMSDAIKKNLIYVCLAGLILFYVYHCFYWYKWVVDDAYITFRYARNLNRGLGLVYNRGERVEGFSNFSWLWLIAAGMKAGFDPIVAARFWGILSGIGAIICSYWLFNIISPRPNSFASLSAPLLLATNSFFCYWSFAGLETTFYSLVLILSAILYIKENRNRSPHVPWSAFTLGLLVISRPDGLGYLSVFLFTDVWFRLKEKRFSNRYSVKFYGVIAVFLFSFFSFRLIYFDSFYPNTYYAKILSPFQNLKSTLVYFKGFYLNHSLSLPILSLLSIGICLKYLPKTGLLILLLLFNWFYIIYVPFDWMPNYRYHMFTLPILFTLIGLGSSGLIRITTERKQLWGVLAGVVLSFMVVHQVNNLLKLKTASAFREQYLSLKPYEEKPARWLRKIPRKLKKGIRPGKRIMEQTLFLIENTTPEMTVGMRDIGFPGFIVDCRVYDRDMLIHREARYFARAIKSRDKSTISSYIFGPMRRNLEKYGPDFFLYPEARYLSPELFEWDKVNRMYNGYFTDRMELVKEGVFKKTVHAYYRKKELNARLSTRELIEKYQEIIKRNPLYPAFQERLDELKEDLKSEEKI